MAEKIRPFLAINRQWMIKRILVSYFRAKNTFANIDREVDAGRGVTFDNILKLSDGLFKAKEEMHLLFQRARADGQPAEHEKLEPTGLEVDLINNVGLLFHKAMVVREQVYILEHYADESADRTLTRADLDVYMGKMRNLFNQGLEIISGLLRDYRDNEVLLILHDHQCIVSVLSSARNSMPFSRVCMAMRSTAPICWRESSASTAAGRRPAGSACRRPCASIPKTARPKSCCSMMQISVALLGKKPYF